MKRLTFLSVPIAAVFLLWVPSGWCESTAQGTQIHTNDTLAATDLKTASTNDRSSPATVTLSGGVRPVEGLAFSKVNSKVTVTLPDGRNYEGEVIAGKANGEGTLTDADGTKQYGEWRDGKEYRVSGTLVYPDGTKETGTWNADGSKSGGTIIWKDGRQYKGGWKLADGLVDLPDGEGEMTWPDGRKYAGSFRNGYMDGLGKMTYPGRNIQNGWWKQDKFFESVP